MKITIPDKTARDLEYYLIRSVLLINEDPPEYANIVADEAACGNKLGIRAMQARTDAMDILRDARLKKCTHSGDGIET